MREMLETMAATALGAAAGGLAWAVRGRSSTVFGPSVWHGNRHRRSISLTFDDGPSEATDELLDLLARHEAKATFFQCGRNVVRLPEAARRVAAAGHEVGNHGFSHQRFYLRSSRFLREEIVRAQEVIGGVCGRVPLLFRAPFGVRWFGLREVQRELNLLGVMWTGIGLDWKLPAPQIVSRLLRYACNGAILCLHDGRGIQREPDVRETLEAVRRLLPELRARGFQLQTVSQLLCPTS